MACAAGRLVRLAVVVPARQAAALLSDCLASISRQSRAADEVWLMVGPSTDGTLEVARTLAGGAVRVIENPAGDRGSAINLALAASMADAFAMVDCQARLAPDYLEQAQSVLDASGADVVGGPMRPEGRTAIGRSMAIALRSPFGIGDSQFHFGGEARWVESVYLGVYRASVFASVGSYNAALLRTEDDDLNWRVRAAGLRIRLDPRMCSTYLCRNDLAGIWRQFFGYGYWKVALATLRPGALRLRHFIPVGFVLALIVATAASLSVWRWAFPALALVYLAAASTAAVLTPGSPAARLLFPLVTMAMHLGYGVGTLLGLCTWRSLARAVRRDMASP